MTPPQLPRSSRPADRKQCHQTTNLISEAQNGCCLCEVSQPRSEMVSRAGGFKVFDVIVTFSSILLVSLLFISFAATLWMDTEQEVYKLWQAVFQIQLPAYKLAVYVFANHRYIGFLNFSMAENSAGIFWFMFWLTWFCHPEQGWKMSQRLIRYVQFCCHKHSWKNVKPPRLVYPILLLQTQLENVQTLHQKYPVVSPLQILKLHV